MVLRTGLLRAASVFTISSSSSSSSSCSSSKKRGHGHRFVCVSVNNEQLARHNAHGRRASEPASAVIRPNDHRARHPQKMFLGGAGTEDETLQVSSGDGDGEGHFPPQPNRWSEGAL